MEAFWESRHGDVLGNRNRNFQKQSCGTGPIGKQHTDIVTPSSWALQCLKKRKEKKDKDRL